MYKIRVRKYKFVKYEIFYVNRSFFIIETIIISHY